MIFLVVNNIIQAFLIRYIKIFDFKPRDNTYTTKVLIVIELLILLFYLSLDQYFEIFLEKIDQIKLLKFFGIIKFEKN